jgi:hypothetical protein
MQMPNLTFEFAWYKDSKGYRLIPTKPIKVKRGQSESDAVLEMLATDVQPTRIVGNGGSLVRVTPLKIDDLFKRFSKIETHEEVLKFVRIYGPLTLSGLRGNGDVVEKLIDEAHDMRSGVSKPLGKLNVTVVNSDGKTQLKVRPVCLLDAIWLQYAQANTPSRKCQQCDKSFLVGAGTGRRADAKFCMSECRVKFNSLGRSRWRR